MKEPNSARRKPERAKEAQAAFEASYRAYQYRFVEFFIEHLADISRAFRGDLQAMIVLALVGQVQMRATRVAVEAGMDPRELPTERVSMSASRIADVTGIPRETVRRKLGLLEDRGWIRCNPDRSWRLVVLDDRVPARTDLNEIDTRAIERVARLFADLERVVVEHAATTRAAPEDGARFGQAPPVS
jgi:hypothetical protein